MAKDKLTEYDATAANNTVVGDVNLAENSALPSDMNNAVREVMSHLKNFSDGTDAIDALDVTGAATVGGNLLVGKTATGLSTTGFQALATGNQSAFISDGDRALILNRKTSDGSILEFRKDGSIVGSIATVSDDLNIFSTTANHTGLRFALNAILPTNTNGSVVDNAVDLGKSSANYRFKDLYLSGGAYIGGTAAANKLDSYEEGTFTPNLKGTTTDPTVSYNSRYGTYTKIGNLVLCQISVDMSSVSGGSGNAFIGDLPFTSANNGANASPHSVMLYNVNVPDDGFAVALRTRNNTADTRFLSMRDNTTWANLDISRFAGSSKVVIATITYMAA